MVDCDGCILNVVVKPGSLHTVGLIIDQLSVEAFTDELVHDMVDLCSMTLRSKIATNIAVAQLTEVTLS